jgi:protein-S-isoprenylcysteine O-methyltransferase Ste14
METDWYFRLFFVNFAWFVISWLLFVLVNAKRMRGAGPPKKLMVVYWLDLITGWVLTWFIIYSIDVTFWIGLGIIIIGLFIYALGYLAMREHPEREQVVVDWGIYKVSRHSHVLAGIICHFGVVVMGWNPDSIIYIILCVYFVLHIILMHFGVLCEEKLTRGMLGQEYEDYMKRVPRYFLGRK